MVIVYRCSGCGTVLYVFNGGDPSGLRSPGEIARLYGYRCPYCGKHLRVNGTDPVRDIEIRRLDANRVLDSLKKQQFKLTCITIKVPEQFVNELIAIAWKKRKPLSEVVREAIALYIALERS